MQRNIIQINGSLIQSFQNIFVFFNQLLILAFRHFFSTIRVVSDGKIVNSFFSFRKDFSLIVMIENWLNESLFFCIKSSIVSESHLRLLMRVISPHYLLNFNPIMQVYKIDSSYGLFWYKNIVYILLKVKLKILRVFVS